MTQLLARLIGHRAAFANMAMLYVGRTSGVLVAFFFLPLYSRLLGAEQFGMVAVILSLQALLVMMDLGMSTIVSRDIAVGESGPEVQFKLILTAELSLSGFYFILLVGTAAVKALGGLPNVDLVTSLVAVTLFWVLVLQNIYYSAMLARRLYISASVIQTVGVIIRASVTVLILMSGYTTFRIFIITQLLLAAIHCGVSRHYSMSILNLHTTLKDKVLRPSLADSVSLLKRGRSLVLFSLAGAAVMQLDKPIITAFASAASVAPYFLATTLCMLPISILAGPISQYFQPILLKETEHKNSENKRQTIKRFVITLLFTVGIPCIIFWFLRIFMIDLWMGQRVENVKISKYVGILLPGCAVGALGFIPYTLLLSAKDFKFQAILSACMTIVTLTGTAVAALFQSIEGVCYIYVAYHSTSTTISWMRAISISATRELAKYSFLLAIKGCGLLFTAATIIGYFIE